ncbi:MULTISPECIES: hypothetical protein [Moorena]|uniref:hypothetical protein n=1 Tax=Moorena TaxID=1155738 RepID=UPI0002F51198|nr:MULTISPECIES: hypothetical protein [Moorena]NEP67434.1 hypothetical protein [Moorena sp. SIO3A5]NEQ08566.1 hypothetical protein [Moorena sp. SIO4E2]
MNSFVERASGVEQASCPLSIFPDRQDAHPTHNHSKIQQCQKNGSGKDVVIWLR